MPEKILPYFDYDAYGRDTRLNEGGCYVLGGYLIRNNEPFVEHYHGLEDIPPEHKVFAYPKLSIRERLAAYKEVSSWAATEPVKQARQPEHSGR